MACAVRSKVAIGKVPIGRPTLHNILAILATVAPARRGALDLEIILYQRAAILRADRGNGAGKVLVR